MYANIMQIVTVTLPIFCLFSTQWSKTCEVHCYKNYIPSLEIYVYSNYTFSWYTLIRIRTRLNTSFKLYVFHTDIVYVYTYIGERYKLYMYRVMSSSLYASYYFFTLSDRCIRSARLCISTFSTFQSFQQFNLKKKKSLIFQ